MASFDFDSNCPLLFKCTNYFLWQETMELYSKRKGLWGIMIKGPIVIEELVHEYTKDDYKRLSKNFKVTNILYCALPIDVCEFISHCDSTMVVWEIVYYLYDTN